MRYGAVLRACRERVGFSQEELADRLYIQQADVSRYENDRKEPSISLFRNWAKETQGEDVLVAFMCGMEGMTIMTDILSTVGTTVSGFINFFY